MAMPHGLKAREYAKYRETRNGEVAVGITNEDEASVETLEVTASGDTQILPAPGSTEYLVIKGFHFSNNDSSKVTVSLKAGAGGLEKFSTVLAANGGSFDKNLIGRYWRIPVNKALIVSLSGASDVFVTVEYEGMDEPGPESAELTDTISFAESLKTEVSSVLGDSQTIAEAVAKSPVHKLSDAETMADSTVRTGNRSINLTDSMAVTESIGNQTTTKLTEGDSLSISAGIVVSLIPG